MFPGFRHFGAGNIAPMSPHAMNESIQGHINIREQASESFAIRFRIPQASPPFLTHSHLAPAWRTP
jgi:hypothetical protein